MIGTHHRPFDDPVFDHEVFDERAVHLGHVVVVVFVAQIWSLVSADGPAEKAARGFDQVVRCSLVSQYNVDARCFDFCFFFLAYKCRVSRPRRSLMRVFQRNNEEQRLIII